MNEPRLTEAEREELVAFLDGETDLAARARIEARLNADPLLRREADELRRVWDFLDHLPRAEPSPTFTSKTLDRLSVLRPQSASATTALPRRWLGAWSAVLAACFLLGIALGGRRPEPPLPRPDDPALAGDGELLDNLVPLMAVETLEFARALNDPRLFGADTYGP